MRFIFFIISIIAGALFLQISFASGTLIFVRSGLVEGYLVNQSTQQANSPDLSLDHIAAQRSTAYRLQLKAFDKTKVNVTYPNGGGCQFIFSGVIPNPVEPVVGTSLLTATPLTPDSVCDVDANASLMVGNKHQIY